MGINTKVLNAVSILEVVYSPGPVTQLELKSHRDSVARILNERSLKKVLVDATAVTPSPSLMTLFEHGKALAEHCTLHKVRIAAVYQAIDHDVQFMETVAVNRGARIRCFPSREEALDWLQ